MSSHPSTARELGMVSCLNCGLVAAGAGDRCPRCRSILHSRKPNSISRTWALLLAAAILYVPANLLPVMETTTRFGVQKDTILSGVVYFWTTGSPGLAILIFSVSVLVPLLKIGALAFLAAGIGRRAKHHAHQRTRLFGFVERIGRWSMLDVFVVALMVGLVRFRGLAVVEAGPGAAVFGAVVVLTILAALSLDPRLIWDNADADDR